MTSHPWNDEMSHLLYKIERETENSICKLKKSLKRCGLQFDGKFRRYFLKATDNRYLKCLFNASKSILLWIFAMKMEKFSNLLINGRNANNAFSIHCFLISFYETNSV